MANAMPANYDDARGVRDTERRAGRRLTSGMGLIDEQRHWATRLAVLAHSPVRGDYVEPWLRSLVQASHVSLPSRANGYRVDDMAACDNEHSGVARHSRNSCIRSEQ